MDSDYFISGSLDSKVRIWNVSDRQVVDWLDLHEMITSASYTPDGQVILLFPLILLHPCLLVLELSHFIQLSFDN